MITLYALDELADPVDRAAVAALNAHLAGLHRESLASDWDDDTCIKWAADNSAWFTEDGNLFLCGLPGCAPN